jgi:hypothetical protein
MSDVSDTQSGLGITAGNTVTSLAPKDVADVAASGLPSAADLDAVAQDFEAALATGKQIVADGRALEVVSREEFEELQDAFLRLRGQIDTFNTKSPHRI